MRPTRLIACLAAIVMTSALAACHSRTVTITELTPAGSAAPRAPESVDVYVDAPPKRPFFATHVIDLAGQQPTTPELLARYRDHAARVGCDGVIVYTEQNPVIKAGPRADNEMLVLETDGVLASKFDGGTVENRRAFAVHTHRQSSTIIIDEPSVALCIAYRSSR